jgi:hypothetical protein
LDLVCLLTVWDDIVHQISLRMIPQLFSKRPNNGRRGALLLFSMRVWKLQGLVKIRHKLFNLEPK